MALLVNAGASSADTNTAVTSAIDTTGATLLVVATIWLTNAGPPTITDSKSNVWGVGLTEQHVVDGLDSRVKLFYVWNPVVGSGHTFTSTLNSSFPAIAVLAFSGTSILADPFGAENGTVQTGANVLTIQAGPVTGRQVVVTAVSNIAAISSYSIDSGFTITDQAALVGGTSTGYGMAYKVSAIGSQDPTWTHTVPSLRAAVIASFGTITSSPSHFLNLLGCGT